MTAFCTWPPIGPSVTYQLFTPSSQSISATAAGCSQGAKWPRGLTLRMRHPPSVAHTSGSKPKAGRRVSDAVWAASIAWAAGRQFGLKGSNKIWANRSADGDLVQRTKPQEHGRLAQYIFIMHPWGNWLNAQVTLMSGFFFYPYFCDSFQFLFEQERFSSQHLQRLSTRRQTESKLSHYFSFIY